MRFSNENYLRAFPRSEEVGGFVPQVHERKVIKKEEPGDVFDTGEPEQADPEPEVEPDVEEDLEDGA